MRTYGRIYNPDGSYTWVKIETDEAGYNDNVWVTTLVQCLKLELNESPFYANFGIPAQRSVLQQIFPDFYVTQTQQQFAPHFANLMIAKVDSPTPTYNISVTTTQGANLAIEIPV